MNLRRLAFITILIVIIFSIFIFILFLLKTNPLKTSNAIDTSIFADYGSLVGGIAASIFSLASILLVLQTLKEQESQHIREGIESRFFELVKLHRDNVVEFNSKGRSGRSVVIQMYDEFIGLYEAFKTVYTFELSKLKDIKIWRRKVAEIAYTITYFGLGDRSREIIESKIKEIVSDADTYNLIVYPLYLKHLVEEYDKIKKNNKNITDRTMRKYLNYDGHQLRLGHYFRHLFQAYVYINAQNTALVPYIIKYEYLRVLRAQLSAYEEAIIFCNSLTSLGDAWELAQIDENNKLITKFNIIKNIPTNFMGDLNPQDYYPDVYYEILKVKPFGRNAKELLYK